MVQQLACNFDEASGNVIDHSGQGHDFALNNGLKRVAGGKFNGGLSKDGGAGVMGLVTNSPFVTSAAWTIMFWQRNPGNSVWWLRLYNAAADTGHGILNAGTLRLRIRTAAGSNVEVTTAPPAQDDVWRHYAGTYDGSVGRFYINGSLIGTTSAVPSPAAIDRIDIAEHTLDNFGMDDVRIYDEALSEAAINLLKDTPVEAESTVSGTLALALGSPTAALLGQAQSNAGLTLSLAAPVVAVSGRASAAGQFGLQLGQPSLVMFGQAQSAGVLGLVLASPVVSLRQAGGSGSPLVGTPVQGPPVLTGVPVGVSQVLAGGPVYG